MSAEQREDLTLAPAEEPFEYVHGDICVTEPDGTLVIVASSGTIAFAAMQAMLWRAELHKEARLERPSDNIVLFRQNAYAWQSEAERRYDAAVAAFGEKGEGDD